MKNILLLIFCVLNFIVYAQQWEWAKNISYSYSSYYSNLIGLPNQNNLATDENGNFYISTNFDSACCIAKFNSQGNEQWRSYLMGNRILINGITSTKDAIYLVGSFENSLQINNITLTSNGLFDIFFIKFTSNGDFVFAKAMGGVSEDNGNGICSDKNGNIYLTGEYSDTATFETQKLICQCVSHIFIVKYDSSGNILFLKSSECENDYGHSLGKKIIVDHSGNIYTIGDHNYFILDTFFVGEGGGPYGASFLSKMDSSGKVKWVQVLQGTILELKDIALDTGNNVLLTGDTHWQPGGNTFAQKYNSSGQMFWKSETGGAGCWGSTAKSEAIVTENLNSYIIGRVYWGGNNCTSSFNGLLIVKYDSIGVKLLYDTIPTNSSVDDIIRDSNGDFVICGTLDYGSIILGNDSLYTTNEKIFIAKFKGINPTTAFDNLTSLEAINISPNPSSGIFTLNFKNKTVQTKICVYDVLGKCLLNKVYSNEVSPKIDLSNQPTGIYFVEMICGNERETRKIIIE